MQTAMILALATAGFTTYPGFGDTASPVMPRPTTSIPALKIEALVDRGPIVEMIIRCGAHTAIISYSKVEKLYCTPKMACNSALDKTLAATCGQPAAR